MVVLNVGNGIFGNTLPNGGWILTTERLHHSQANLNVINVPSKQWPVVQNRGHPFKAGLTFQRHHP